MKILVIILIALLIGFISLSFVSKCIAPGEGVSAVTRRIKVPVFMHGMDPNDPKTLWLDTGESISESEDITISSIQGSINFCINQDPNICKINCSELIVPASFCKDGTVPNYSQDIDDTSFSDPSIVCKDHGEEFSSEGSYVDSNIKVNPGDILHFSLIPRDFLVDNCLSDKITIFESGNLVDKDGNEIRDKDDNSIAVQKTNLCMEPISVNISEGNNQSFGGYYGQSYKIMVDNSFTPYGNKVYKSYVVENNVVSEVVDDCPVCLYFASHGMVITKESNQSSRTNPWIQSKLLDLREFSDPFNDSKSHVANNTDACAVPLDNIMGKLPSYHVNLACGIICGEDGKSDTDDCIDSVLYKVNNFNIPDFGTIESQSTTEYTMKSLVAKIGNNELSFDSTGQQCLPNNATSTCLDESLNHPGILSKELQTYTVSQDVEPYSSLMLGISGTKDNYNNHIGGYNVKVEKKCNYSDGEKLYIYIGDGPPDVRPGEEGTFSLKPKEVEIDDGIFFVEPTRINEISGINKRGKIYLGIQGAAESETVMQNIDSENNYYEVVIPRHIWKPIVSKLFVKIRDVLLSVIYGDKLLYSEAGLSKEGELLGEYGPVVRDSSYLMETGALEILLDSFFDSGFGSFVQALLVIYVAVSALGFMIGVIKASGFEVVLRIIKFSIIALLLKKSSFALISKTIFDLFVMGSNQLVGIFASASDTDYHTFSFIDKTIGTFFATETWLRLASLIPTGIIGIIFGALIFWAMFNFLIASFEAMIIYLGNIMYLALLISVAPIFIITVLFQKTNALFQSWLKLCISSALSPVLMFAAISLLHQLVMGSFYVIMSYGACTQCWWNINLDFVKSGLEFCMIKSFMPDTYMHAADVNSQIAQTYHSLDRPTTGFMGLPFRISDILILLIGTYAMETFIKISSNIVQSITSSMSSATYGYSMDAPSSPYQTVASLFGRDNKTLQQIDRSSDPKRKSRDSLSLEVKRDDSPSSEQKAKRDEEPSDHKETTPKDK